MSGSAGRKETLAWCFYRNPRHPYDGFMANYLFKPLRYTFVRKHYDRLLAEFVRELPEVGHHFSTVHGAGGKGVKIANSFTLLEAAAEVSGRDDLASRTGISEGRLLDLVHRADVSRLPYTSGGAVKRLWKMGYRSLAALRLADPQEYAVRIEAYFAAGGKGPPSMQGRRPFRGSCRTPGMHRKW